MEDRLSNLNRFPVICLRAISFTKLIVPSLWPRLSPLAALLIVACSFIDSSAMADEPDWIWTPKTTIARNKTAQGECFFRKKFSLVGPEKAEMIFSAGDEYEIYLNDRLVSRGQSFGESKTVDVTEFIEPGINLLAAHVKHYESPVPGLAMKFRVKERSETRWRSLGTDHTWQTRVVENPRWTESSYSATGWLAAKSTSAEQVAAIKQKRVDETKAEIEAAALLAKQKQAAKEKLAAENQANQEKIAAEQKLAANKVSQWKFIKSAEVTKGIKSDNNQLTGVKQALIGPVSKPSRFDINSEFAVGQVLSAKETGSLIAMEFDEFGKLLLSKDGGPLMIADPAKSKGDPSRIRVYCDEVTSCRGILPLNGSIYVTAKSSNGLGLYQLKDVNKTGKLTIVRQLLSFAEESGNGGPHGIQLGPEGMLYVVVGKNCEIDQELATTSPFKNNYPASVVPEFEPVKDTKPGWIVRVSLDGKKVERVAGGIHDAGDLIVDANNEMFLHDRDTRADMGLTWHRPSLAYHVPAGADLGWRNGGSSFPEYFVDGTQAMATTDHATPTGAVLYQHVQFPQRYHNAIFFADWSQGRILSVKPLPNGAGFTAEPKEFLAGRPLNVSDLAVGQDGYLYFCTGGRGTEGGVYRVSWRGDVPANLIDYKDDLDRALRHPQPQSAWARQSIATLRIKMGRDWNKDIEAAALDTAKTTQQRLRALHLMGMYGPRPSRELLETLHADGQPAIRAQIARMCARKVEAIADDIVLALVNDKNPYVRRIACEACVRMDIQSSFESLTPMLMSDNNVEALAARRLLQRIPSQQWQAKITDTDDKRLFINGALALLSEDPTLEQGYEILAKSSHLLDGFLTDSEFVDVLRTVQLALTQCKVDPSRVSGFTTRIVNEFPSSSSTLNHELARVLGYLQAGNFSGRLETYLADENTSAGDRVHTAMHLLNGEANLTGNEQVAILNVLETAGTTKSAGGNYNKYVRQAIKKISVTIAGNDIPTVLANGHRWPKTVLTAFYKMPEKLDDKTVDAVIKMDQRMVELGSADVATEQVRLGVIAILARDGSEAGMQYLRELWLQEPDRRSDIVIGLSQQPGGENWAYLVGSLPGLDDLTAADVLTRLTSVGQRPQEAKYYRQVIEAGYRLRGQGAHLAADLLLYWSGQTEANKTPDWQTRLAEWSAWYENTFPKSEAIAQDINQKVIGRYSTAAIVDEIEKVGLGDAVAGRHVFAKANCASCHRVGRQGLAGGPDLTDMAARFSVRETIAATVDPSAVVLERYQSKKILTVDGIVHHGMEVSQTDGSYVLLNPQAKLIRIDAKDVQEVSVGDGSAMPEGLLDNLSVTEVRDLMAYLMQQSQSTLADQQSEAPAARIGAMPAVQEVR